MLVGEGRGRHNGGRGVRGCFTERDGYARTHTHTHAEEESSNAVTRIRLRNMRVRFFRRPFFFEPTLKQMRRKYVWIEIFSKKLYSPFVVLLLVK